MHPTPTYEQRLQGFDWSLAEQELGYQAGQPLNIGWYCSDRICELGLATKPALIWEDNAGNGRTYSFDELRVLSDTFAAFLQDQGLQAGDDRGRGLVGDALHQRHHRPAEGRPTSTTPSSASTRPASTRWTCSRTTSTGAPPTPAG
jgi:hypothetical protein